MRKLLSYMVSADDHVGLWTVFQVSMVESTNTLNTGLSGNDVMILCRLLSMLGIIGVNIRMYDVRIFLSRKSGVLPWVFIFGIPSCIPTLPFSTTDTSPLVGQCNVSLKGNTACGNIKNVVSEGVTTFICVEGSGPRCED